VSVRAAVVLTAVAALCWVVHGITGSGDYQLGYPVLADNAAPAITALTHGQLGRAAALQPLMGLVSLAWRAPFAAAAEGLGSTAHVVYQVGALACLLPVLGAAWWLAQRALSIMQATAAVVAIALIAAGPITSGALLLGHPEEVLTALLASASVICAGQDRRRCAAILLGLAVGTKPWALIAAPCVLLALPGRRVMPATLAAAVAAVTAGLLPVLDLTAYRTAGGYIGDVNFANPWTLWWPLSGRPLGARATPAQLLPLGLTRTGAVAIVFVLAAAAISAYAWRTHKRRGGVDALALFCALGLVRCLADPAPTGYYFAVIVIPLALWEAGVRRRLPVLAIFVSLVVHWLPDDFVAARNHGALGLGAMNAVWLAGALALGVYLVRSAVGPRAAGGVADQLAGRASGWRGSPSSGTGSHAAA
jgi:hypothetical protein